MNPQEFSITRPPVTEAPAEAAPPVYYEWAAPGGGLTVRIHFEVVDELGFEVMRGFGAIPRRGAEVGGLLIGAVNEDGRTVTVSGFRPVPCRHSRGPSYILEDEELRALETGLMSLEPGPGKGEWAIGFYRSNTREALELVVEDQDLLERFFPAEPVVCLMVRPFATRVSEATFFWRSGGKWAGGGVESVFPFRRSELGGGKRPRRTRVQQEAEAPSPVDSLAPFEVETPYLPPHRAARTQPTPEIVEEALAIPIPAVPEFAENHPTKLRGSWVWIPLSFVFLLLGIVLGFQIALSVSRSQRAAENQVDPYALDLKVVEFGESLHLKWDSSLPAFRAANNAILHIRDGNNTKTVEINRDDIARGGILYRNATQEVQFRLEVPQRERNSISETVDVRIAGPDPAVR